MEEKKRRPQISSAGLHILAMVLMTLDHIWGSFPGTGYWMTCVGRIAFPIFAFLLAEGFRRTRSVKRYALRLLLFAILSEVPFDLMYEGMVFDPFHQNVLWTFLIALLGMALMERAHRTGRLGVIIPADLAVAAVTYLLGLLLFTDYNGPGVLTVYVFYFLRNRKWWCFLGQGALLLFISVVLIKGYYYPVTIGPWSFELPRQGLSVLALLPIWLYRGKKGHHSKPFRFACYAFYPVHTLLLYFLAR